MAEAPCITSSWAGVLFLFVRVTLHQIELELMCTIGLQLSIGEDKYIIALLDDARLVPLSYKPNVLFHVKCSDVNIYFRLIWRKFVISSFLSTEHFQILLIIIFMASKYDITYNTPLKHKM